MWGMQLCKSHDCLLSTPLSTPTHVGNATNFTFHSRTYAMHAFNPHSCGECNLIGERVTVHLLLSTPTHVGNATALLKLTACRTSFQPPLMWGMQPFFSVFNGYLFGLSTPTHVGNATITVGVGITLNMIFQPPLMWGMQQS